MALRKLVAYFLTLFITSGFSSKCAGSINEQFIQKIDHEKNDTARIKRMLEYANYLSKTNKDSSNKYILYIKQQASKINYFKGVIDCYLELGANYSFDFIFDMADSIYNEAIIYSKKYGAYALPTLTNNLANVYTGQHKYDQAQNILFENLKVAENKKDTLLMIDCIMGIGGVYLEAADYKNAQTYINKLQTIINKTAQLSENDHKKYQSTIYSRLSVLNFRIGNYNESIHYTRLLSQFQSNYENKYEVQNNYNSLGVCFYYLGNIDSCVYYLEKAYEAAKELNIRLAIGLTANNLAELYLSQKKYEKAFQKITESLAISTKDDFINQTRDSYELLSQYYEQKNDPAKALVYFRKFKLFDDSISNSQRHEELVKREQLFEQERTNLKFKQEKKLQETELKKRNTYILFFGVGFAMLLVLVFVLYRSFISKKRANEIIEGQKILVEEKNKEIVDSIHYAKYLQEAILPPINVVKKYFNDCFILYKPKDIVAGDFYFFEALQVHTRSENNQASSLIIAAADCTGHGVPGAMVSVVCSNALNRAVKEFGLRSPGEILNKVRELVIETFEKSEQEVKDGMDISLCILNTQNLELTWAGANIPLWYIKDGLLHEIKGDKQPVGKHINPQPFKTHLIKLNKNDVFYCFTDGYADQFGGPKGKKFKYLALKELLTSISKDPCVKQLEILNHTFMQWKQNHEQIDDVTIIGVKV